MSANVVRNFITDIAPGIHGYQVPKPSGSMEMACHTERGVRALYVSRYGVQGGYFAAILNDAIKTARLLTAIAYYLLGVAQIVQGSLALYWSVKRSHFFSKVREGLNQRDSKDAQADYVWDVFQAHMSVDSKSIDKDLEKFKKEYDAKGISVKQAALVKDYEDELNSWLDYFSNVSYSIQSWMVGLFGKKLRGENLVQKRHAQVRQDLQFISNQMKAISSRGATAKEMHQTLDNFKKARIEDIAQRANLKALSCLTSTEFAAELYHNRNTADRSLERHRGVLLNAYLKAESNYHAVKVADVVEGVAQVVIGLVSIILVATVKAAWVKIFLSVLGGVIYTKTVIQGVDTVRYLFGVETRETFAQEIHKLFNTLNSERIQQIHFDNEIYGDY